MTGKKTLGESVQYLKDFHETMEKRVKGEWNLGELQIVLVQAVGYLMQLCANSMMDRPEGWSNLDVWNKKAGIELKRLGICHSVCYTYNAFKAAVEVNRNRKNQTALHQLCQLFGINSIVSFSSVVVEGGFVLPEHISSLLALK